MEEKNMNKNKKVDTDSLTFSINYKHPLAKEKLSHFIFSKLPLENQEIVIMCIGSDRSTGDALGPLAGSLLTMINPNNLIVYGTLHEPIHAINLTSFIKYINKKHKNPFIIAIDASLGRKSSVGSLISGTGPIKPGAAVNKNLPPIGDIHLISVVNMYSMMSHSILQNTRLSLIYDMAIIITNILHNIDQKLSRMNVNYQKIT